MLHMYRSIAPIGVNVVRVSYSLSSNNSYNGHRNSIEGRQLQWLVADIGWQWRRQNTNRFLDMTTE